MPQLQVPTSAESTDTVTVVITPPAAKSFVNKVPANWVLTAADGSDDISAYNNQSNEIFEGSVKEFNTLLRG